MDDDYPEAHLTEDEFQVGDIVTRCGDDRHRVVEVGDYNDITVECLVPSKQASCFMVGDTELNLAGRYRLIARKDHQA